METVGTSNDHHWSFGWKVQLSKPTPTTDGNPLTVAILGSYYSIADNPNNVTYPECLIHVYRYKEEIQDWVQLGQDITNDKEETDEYDLHECRDMVMSSDGSTIVAGVYEYNAGWQAKPHGHVRVWTLDESLWQWKRKGRGDVESLIRVGIHNQYNQTRKKAWKRNTSFVVGRVASLSHDGNRLVVLSGESSLDKHRLGSYKMFLTTLDYHDAEPDLDDKNSSSGGGTWKVATHEVPLHGEPLSMAMLDAGTHLALGFPDAMAGHGRLDTWEYWEGP